MLAALGVIVAVVLLLPLALFAVVFAARWTVAGLFAILLAPLATRKRV